MPPSLQIDLQHNDTLSQSRSIVIPLRRQLHYIMVSLFTLVWPWITRALDERITSHYLSTFVKQCVLGCAARVLYLRPSTYQQFYCHVLFVLTTLASFAHLIPSTLFASESVSLKDLIIRFCLAYFLVSEVDWWYKLHEYVEHPTAGVFRLSWCHIGLSGIITSTISWILMCALGVGSILLVAPWRGGRPSDYTGTALYVLVLLRPVHLLSVWLCETSWQELRDLQIGTWMVC